MYPRKKLLPSRLPAGRAIFLFGCPRRSIAALLVERDGAIYDIGHRRLASFANGPNHESLLDYADGVLGMCRQPVRGSGCTHDQARFGDSTSPAVGCGRRVAASGRTNRTIIGSAGQYRPTAAFDGGAGGLAGGLPAG